MHIFTFFMFLVNVIMYLFYFSVSPSRKRQNPHVSCDNILKDTNPYAQLQGGDTLIEKVIYGDVLLVINFCMDFLALYITAKIMHLKIRKARMTAASCMGALYSLVILSPHLSWGSGIIPSLAIAFLITATAYGKQNFKERLKNTSIFFIVNFSLGGGITALCNLMNIWQNNRNIVINGAFDTLYGELPFGMLVLLGGICGIFSLMSGKLIKKKTAEQVCEVTITFNKKVLTLKALVDSGNLLKEPISGRPVIIAAFESVRQTLPVELIPLFKNKNTSNIENIDPNAGIRAIPVSTVNSKGILFALLPDSVKLNGKEIDVCLALTGETKSFGGYPAVVPSEIIQ